MVRARNTMWSFDPGGAHVPGVPGDWVYVVMILEQIYCFNAD